MTDAPLHIPAALRPAYAAVDWAATPLGPMAGWSPTLRGIADVMFNTRFPMTLLWGPSYVLVYNEAYVRMIADKHPAALGRPAVEVFPEAWDAIGPMMDAVFTGGSPTWVEDALVPLLRHGALEEAYFTFSYSAVRAPGGAVEGLVDIATETTPQVVTARRLLVLARLREALAAVDRAADVPARALQVLGLDARDFEAVALGRGSGAGRETVIPVSAPEGDDPLDLVATRHFEVRDDADFQEFLRLIGASLSQAIDRLRLRESARSLSEALQRSLLTAPPHGDDVQIAARYQPAASQAQIGGDWYDAFPLPGGALAIGVGDVSGHDRQAATAMAQLRNLLRGIAGVRPEPSAVLDGLDRAIADLGIGTYATAVLGSLAPRDAADPAGVRRLRICNAGHLPPVVVEPDGRARLLATDPELLLGAARDVGRAEHDVGLAPGATVVLFTDGLVERRDRSITTTLDALVEEVGRHHALPVEALCDHLMARLGADARDDIALLVLRLPAAG